jgi:hypothetical protein
MDSQLAFLGPHTKTAMEHRNVGSSAKPFHRKSQKKVEHRGVAGAGGHKDFLRTCAGRLAHLLYQAIASFHQYGAKPVEAVRPSLGKIDSGYHVFSELNLRIDPTCSGQGLAGTYVEQHRHQRGGAQVESHSEVPIHMISWFQFQKCPRPGEIPEQRGGRIFCCAWAERRLFGGFRCVSVEGCRQAGVPCCEGTWGRLRNLDNGSDRSGRSNEFLGKLSEQAKRYPQGSQVLLQSGEISRRLFSRSRGYC